jgi:hypothetical protein
MIEVLDVSVAPDRTKVRSSIEDPTTGRRYREVNRRRLPIVGWVFGLSSQASAVHVIHQGRILETSALGNPRPDVALAFSDVTEAKSSGFKMLVDISDLAPEFDLEVWAHLVNGDRVQIGSIQVRHDAAQTRDAQPTHEHRTSTLPVPTVKRDLEKLILATAAQYAVAGNDTIIEGVSSIDDLTAEMHLKERAAALDRIDFKRKKVLVIGAGLGGASRLARARDAALVDSFDPDPQRVALARLLNAYQQATRVSFSQREIAREEVYAEHYDLVLAFAGLDVIAPALGRIAAITDGAFVTEVAAGEGEAIPESISSRFAFCETLEVTPGALDRSAPRYVIASKTEAQLAAALAPPVLAEEPPAAG